MPEEKLICHVCKKEKKPYTVIMNTSPLSLATYFTAREDGEICERCDNYYAMTGVFKDATKEEYAIAEKAAWFSHKVLKWWEKDKKMDDADDESKHKRVWEGTDRIIQWYNDKFRNEKEAKEFAELLLKLWEKDKKPGIDIDYEYAWMGTHFIAEWCRKELTKNGGKIGNDNDN